MKSNFKWCDNSLIYGPFFCLCLSEKEYKKQVKRLGINAPNNWLNENANATVHYLTNQECKLCCIVCLGDYTNRNLHEIYGLLIHESVHIWQQFKEWIGEKEPSREFEAYCIQAIAQELILSFDNQK